MGAQLAVVVTVAAMFLVPTALGRQEWPKGDLGEALDGALLAALGIMTLWVIWIAFS